MKRLILLFSLLLSALAGAQDWEILEPGFPVLGAPGEEVQIRLAGPAGEVPDLTLAGRKVDLVETDPGEYTGSVRIPSEGAKTVALGDKPQGELSVWEGPAYFQSTTESVTRQGPNPLYDRLTPLYPGTRVSLDGRRGDWYRCSQSGTWIDGGGGSLVEGYLPPNRLKRVLVEDDPANGDALLVLECAYPGEVQVEETPDRLQVRLENTYQTDFDVKRPSGVAPYLGPVLLYPRTAPRTVEIGLTSSRLVGYQVEPRAEKNQVVFRLRKPMKSEFRGLKITVDAGHGGPKDKGTVGHGGLAEKTLNLRVAKALAAKLEALGAQVTMTRTTDTNVATAEEGDAHELQSRIDRSMAAGSQLFISVHHNARPSVEEGKAYHGTDVYWYQPHSQKLAKALADPLADAIGEETRSFRWRSFYVIRQTHAPAVLIEFQYLSNPDLEKNVLTKDGYPEKAAEAVIKGLRRYLVSQ